MNIIPNFWTVDYSVEGKESISRSFYFFPPSSYSLALLSTMDPSSPCVYTPPDALGTSTGDSISTLPNTIRADTPRPSETGNMSTSVDSAGYATQQNTKRSHWWPATISEWTHCISSKSKTITAADNGRKSVVICHALCCWRRIQGQTCGLGYLTFELRSRQIFMQMRALLDRTR